MAVTVKWFPTLVKRTQSKQAQTSVPWREGLTPLEIFLGEGFNAIDAEAVMTIVNNEQAKNDAPLRDGDQLEFMVSIQGG